MDKIARVRQEIERLRQVYYNKESEWESRSDDRHGYAIWYEGKVHMCDEILSFLDTLSEEPDKSLEEEIRRYKEHYIKVKECGFSFDLMDIESTARHFAEWGDEHLRDTTKMIDMSLEEAAEEFAEGEWDGVAVDTDGNPLYAQDEIEYTFKAGAQWGAEHLRDSTKMIGKSMEEAAEISFDEADALTEDYMNFLAKGLTENKPRPIGPHWFSEYAKKRFIAGAEWQKSQMLKDAFMNNYVVHDGRIELEGDPLPSLDPILLLPYPQFKPGDKVKVIVLKDNEDESE